MYGGGVTHSPSPKFFFNLDKMILVAFTGFVCFCYYVPGLYAVVPMCSCGDVYRYRPTCPIKLYYFHYSISTARLVLGLNRRSHITSVLLIHHQSSLIIMHRRRWTIALSTLHHHQPLSRPPEQSGLSL